MKFLLMNTKSCVQVAAVVAAVLISLPAFALNTDQSKSLTASISTAKAVEVPAKAAALVAKAIRQDRSDVASVVVSSAAASHPSTLVNVVSSILEKFPKELMPVVTAALSGAPDSSIPIVAAAVNAVPDRAEEVVALASKLSPARTAAFQKEAASAKQRRVVSSAAATTGGSISQTDRAGGSVNNLYASPGSDPSRP